MVKKGSLQKKEKYSVQKLIEIRCRLTGRFSNNKSTTAKHLHNISPILHYISLFGLPKFLIPPIGIDCFTNLIAPMGLG